MVKQSKRKRSDQVPERADHEERRRQVADALPPVAAARGLYATGMREVAAETGVSPRLVRYCFGSKGRTHIRRHAAAGGPVRRAGHGRISQLRQTGSLVRPRDVIAAILTEALPADDEMRTFYGIYTACLALSLTDPVLAIAPPRQELRRGDPAW
jgi:AcrR family transcriptional regulator